MGGGLHSFLVWTLGGGERLTSHPGRFTPDKGPWYAFYRSLGGPRTRSGRFGEEKTFLPLLGFEPETAQPVA
jgi:hypothetical protein